MKRSQKHVITNEMLSDYASRPLSPMGTDDPVLIRMAFELLKLRALSVTVQDYCTNHHQRSDDPAFDALCFAYTEACGRDPRE